MKISCEKKKPTAHSQNMLHVDVLYTIKRKKYKTVCAELAFTKSPSTYGIAKIHGNHSNTEIIHDIIIILRTFDEVRFALYVSGLFAEKKRSILSI
jgi:hypothetical protein